MANTTISPNMSLPVPTVGEDPGPDWATNYNACMSAIDSHTHSSGQGVQITPTGLNINADLAISGNNIITARSLRFQPQTGNLTGSSDLGILYENGVDLYYRDGSGNNIRITQTGSVSGSSGTITGLPSGTASAAFAAGTFTFQSATNTPAAMNVGPVTIGQAVASGYGVTVSAAVGQAANYNLALPAALPGSTKILTLDSSGNIGDTLYVDNSTIEVSANNLQLKDQGVVTAKVADGAIGPVQTTIHYGMGSSSGTFSTSSASFSTITNCSVGLQIINATNPVTVALIPASGSSTLTLMTQTAGGVGVVEITRNGTTVATFQVSEIADGPYSLSIIDVPGTGTITYAVRARTNGVGTFTVRDYRLYIRES